MVRRKFRVSIKSNFTIIDWISFYTNSKIKKAVFMQNRDYISLFDFDRLQQL